MGLAQPNEGCVCSDLICSCYAFDSEHLAVSQKITHATHAVSWAAESIQVNVNDVMYRHTDR